MKTIKLTDSDGIQRIYNPMYVTDVKLITNEYNKEWCVVLFINGHNRQDYSYIYPCKSKEEAESLLNKINDCLESI